MFSLMGNCISWMKRRGEPLHKVTIVTLGLDNSGKTCAVKGLQGETLENLAPTVGFSNSEFKYLKFDIKMFDLGGGKRIRGIWSHYFAEVHGVVYVLDSSDHNRLEESKKTLHDLIEHTKIAGKPILLLANKQDVEGAMDEIDICEHFNLEELVNINKCPCRLETCVAIKGQGKKLDKPIHDGMAWLLETIKHDYDTLNRRVEEDTSDQREKEKLQKAEKRERIRKNREERERKEREEAERSGTLLNESEGDDVVDGENPFKPLDMNKLKAKEAKLKSQKEEMKLKEKNALLSKKSLRQSIDQVDIKEGISKVSASGKSPRAHSDEVSEHMYTSLRGNGFLNKHDGTDDGNSVSDVTPRSSGRLPSLDGELDGRKKKKKNKFKKNNKTAPAPVDGADSPTDLELSKSLNPHMAWNTPPESRAHLGKLPSLKTSQKLDPISEPVKTDFSGDKWNLAEDLPEPTRRFGPNMDYDDNVIT